MKKSRFRSPEAKLRGIPRRLRALRRWRDSFKGFFPFQRELLESGRYWSHKIPADWLLLEGKRSTSEVKREVAQMLVDACAHLVQAKPKWAIETRVVAWICVPNLWSSELCIFLDEAYFLSKVRERSDKELVATRLSSPTLSEQWSLQRQAGIAELGTHWLVIDDDKGGQCEIENWMYGEVAV